MEHFKSPFGPSDFVSSRIIENRKFFDDMIHRAKRHRYFSHPFMSAADDTTPSPDAVSFVLTSMYKLVSPFTGLLCSLGGRAPDLQSRFALMDNIYEEMGCGDLNSAHPNLYLKMLSSIGITQAEAERGRTLPAIRRINEHLRDVVDRRHFAVGCAVLAAAEVVIPPLFPILTRMARGVFPDIDRSFFDRHGPRDQAHSDDAAILFAVCGDRSNFAEAQADVECDLDFRADLLDDWMMAIQRGGYVRMTDHPPRRDSTLPRPSTYPPSLSHI